MEAKFGKHLNIHVTSR